MVLSSGMQMESLVLTNTAEWVTGARMACRQMLPLGLTLL